MSKAKKLSTIDAKELKLPLMITKIAIAATISRNRYLTLAQ